LIRQYLFVLVCSMVAALIQTTVAPFLFHGRLVPDLFLVMVIILGLFNNSLHGAMMAFMLGALEDFYSGQIFGLYMCTRTAVYLVANRLSRRFSPTEPVGQASIALGLGVLDKIMIAGLLALFSSGSAWIASEVIFTALEVVINALLVALFYPMLKWVPGLLEQKTGLKSPIGMMERWK
jgi:rod shape-determining protein MreD